MEDLLASTDEVREVTVVGVDDEKFGQRLAAYVVLRPGRSTRPTSAARSSG